MNYPLSVLTVLTKLRRAGFEGYAVGGCVRDSLLGKAPHDWDVTTSAPPEAMEAAFKGLRVLETGLRHGTLTVLLDIPIEVTTYRAESAYTDHRRPDAVRFVTSLQEDLARRDFTVNAMASSPETGVVDCFGGQMDLANRLLRAVGDPEARFSEDALRILRAVRFSSTLDFPVEELTASAARKKRTDLSFVAPERVYEELKKAVAGAGFARVLREFPDIFETALGAPVNQEAHPSAGPVSAAAGLAFLLDAQNVQAAMERLRADKKTAQAVFQLSVFKEKDPPDTETGARRLLSRIGKPLFGELCTVWEMQGRDPGTVRARADTLLRAHACLSLSDLAIDGRALMESGVPEGPQIGRILNALFQKTLDGTLPNERIALLRAAEELQK